MLIAIAHCLKESEQTKRLAEWLAELGPYPNHRLLVGRDARAEPNLFANSGFASVEEITITGDVWNKWPESCCNAFRQIGKHIEYGTKEPWLWMEVDAILLRKDGFDLIEAEYKASGKPFLGDFVHVPEMMDVPDHMSGVAVYPGILSNFAGSAYLAHETAWDVVAASQIVPQMHRSKHILHRWKHGAFETWEQVQKAIFDVKPEACLFHADKAGSLIDILRAMHNNNSPVPALAVSDFGGESPSCEIPDNASHEARESAAEVSNGSINRDSRGGQFISGIIMKPPAATESTANGKTNAVDWKQFQADAAAGDYFPPRCAPWEDKEQSLSEIEELSERLSQFSGKGWKTHCIRKALHEHGIIEMKQKKRRGKRKRKREVVS